MKMKSNVFGHSAKLALAILVFCGGLLTSCYQKEDIDIPSSAPAEYYIAGTITDANTGALVSAATVTVGGVNVPVTNGTFKSNKLTYTTSAITVVITPTDGSKYYTFTKQVYLNRVNQGAVFIADVSVALITKGDYVVVTEVPLIPPVGDVNDALTDAIIKPTPDLSDGNVGDVTFGTVVKANGTDRVTVEYPFSFENYITSGNVKYISYDGFEFVGGITGASAEDREIIENSVAIRIGKSVGITQNVKTVFLPQWGSYSISGYKAKYTLVAKSYACSINGKTYTFTVVYMEDVTILGTYFNHSTGDAHDGHGQNPNAGGGSGGY